MVEQWPHKSYSAPFRLRDDGTPASVRNGQARGLPDPLAGCCDSETAEQQVEKIADNSDKTSNETHVVFLLRKLS